VVKQQRLKAENARSTFHHTSRGVKMQFIRMSVYWSRSIRIQREDMILPSREDQPNLAISNTDEKLERVECVFSM
jgi:hypothetical protein